MSPYYAAGLALLFLSYRVITGWRGNRISLGSGGNPAMQRLVLGRAVHTHRMSQTRAAFRFHLADMMLTFGVLAAAAGALRVT